MIGGTTSPAAETGLVAAVNVHAEGTDHDDDQDASRTTIEAVTVSQVDNDVPSTMPFVLIVADSLELAEVIHPIIGIGKESNAHVFIHAGEDDNGRLEKPLHAVRPPGIARLAATAAAARAPTC